MLKRLIGALALAVCLAMPAFADDAQKEYAVMLTGAEIKGLQALMDQGVKACGLQCAGPATAILIKLERALKPAEAPKADDKPKP